MRADASAAQDRAWIRAAQVEDSMNRPDDIEVPSTLGFTFIDLFAGIGGLRLGLEGAGGRCVYSVEIDKYAQATYAANFGPVDAGDVRLVEPLTLPRHDVLAAGFPCQPFSIAGV